MARKSRKTAETFATETAHVSNVYNAAAYIRLSVEDNKKKGDSVETQKAILENYIALAPEIKLHGFYIDNGISGSTFEREAFKRMLDDAESGVINCIIVKDLSRLGRNAIDTGYYIEKYLPSIGCRFIAVNDDFDSNTADANSGAGVILPLKNIINEAYAIDIGRKIKAQQRQAMRDGEYVGARPPYGYLKSADNCHKLVVDPVTAPVIHDIFTWFLDGTSVNQIVRLLNESGIPTPSHYRKSLGIITNENLLGNGAWQTFVVSRILINEVYVGDMVQGKSQSTARKQTKVDESLWIRVSDTHEPIISRDVFAQTQERLKMLAEKSASQTKIPYTPNIFKGKVFCGHCGGSMHRTRGSMQKKTGEYRYVFRCLSNDRKARGSCESYTIQEEAAKQALLTAIQSHADVVLDNSVKLRKSSAKTDNMRDKAKNELAALRLAADKDGRMFKSLYESLVIGLITADEYKEMRENYESKMQKNLARAAELERNIGELDKQISEYLELSDLISDADNAGITAKVIDSLIGGIRFFADKRMEVDFLYDKGFGLVNEICGLSEIDGLGGDFKINNSRRYDSVKKEAAADE
jgi:DNA invertase Pin-like site-specific DNA recombinase